MKIYLKALVILTKLFIIGLLMISSSCKLIRPTEMLMEGPDYPISQFEPSKIEYVIQPYDIISLRVSSNVGESFFSVGGAGGDAYQRNRRGFEFPVEFDGLVKVPILGRVNVKGLTIRETEKLLEDKFSEYFVAPFVIVEVTNRQVLLFKNSATNATVIGIPSDRFTLIEAIASTGGLSEISKSHKIKLIRGDLTDNPKVYYWNIRTLDDLRGSNILLEANDIIYVDSRPQYVNRVLREISPYLTAVTTILTIYGIFFIF